MLVGFDDVSSFYRNFKRDFVLRRYRSVFFKGDGYFEIKFSDFSNLGKLYACKSEIEELFMVLPIVRRVKRYRYESYTVTLCGADEASSAFFRVSRLNAYRTVVLL